MRDEKKVIDELGSIMFKDDAGLLETDEEIAVHIMHRFNIDRDTLECMPAFKEPLHPLLWSEKE